MAPDQREMARLGLKVSREALGANRDRFPPTLSHLEVSAVSIWLSLYRATHEPQVSFIQR